MNGFLKFLAVPAFILCGRAHAAIRLPAIFSDHMVLQQKSNVSVWGWAKPGERVAVSCGWSGKTEYATTSATGEWKWKLNTPKAGGPYTLTFSGENKIELKDVLIGEVWLCSGQSNMVFSLKESTNAAVEIRGASYPNIRYFSVHRQYGPAPFKDCEGSVWEKTSPENAPSFSAVAYYFAKKIQERLHVPVGIVYAAWGGTPAEAWTPPNILQHDSALSVYIDRWKKIQDSVGTDSTRWHATLDEWEKNKTPGEKGRKPAEPQTLYYYKRPWREPGVLFNGMINPVIPYKVQGVLWYQGESNVSYADEYQYLFTTMIDSWRTNWKAKEGQKELPFYFVQIAPFGYSNLDAAARLREAQYMVSKKIPSTGMAATIDLGNMKNIHFTDKKQVGDRLALIALAKNYKFHGINYSGPYYKKISAEGNRVLIRFNQPLDTMRGRPPGGFEIGYRTNDSDTLTFVKAFVSVEGSQVTVWNDQVKKPEAVRYAWLLISEATLLNKEGLPAPPFRATVR